MIDGNVGWNDPDMLEVGNGGMNFYEYRSHFALWCLLKAPLISKEYSKNFLPIDCYSIVGCDITNMDNDTKFILKSKELIEVNQDSLGIQGDLIYQVGPIQIWAGPLSGGSRVVVLFNRHHPASRNSTITIHFADLGFKHDEVVEVRRKFGEISNDCELGERFV